MKLIFFVGPYDLIIEKTKTTCPMTVEGKERGVIMSSKKEGEKE